MIARLCNALVVFLVLLLYGFEWVVYNFYCQPAVLSALLFNLTLFVAITSYLRCSFRSWHSSESGVEILGLQNSTG